MIRTPAYYHRRARRRLVRLALYSIFGSLGAVLFYAIAGYYLPIFI